MADRRMLRSNARICPLPPAVFVVVRPRIAWIRGADHGSWQRMASAEQYYGTTRMAQSFLIPLLPLALIVPDRSHLRELSYKAFSCPVFRQSQYYREPSTQGSKLKQHGFTISNSSVC
ncbi:uncharacterized protein TrAFT101_006864 [Trichoderma asperellum]|uniref:uncharacterized protein n=1 Tax=Trichoderma asperellum TaxID=101201 RepID=UPI0033320585|nr:hypothetical protein TrAFT101_006864 [Trichoderma asperellum]